MEIFTANHAQYGHRRIHMELLKQGWNVAKKTVLKLMRVLGLACKVRRKKRYNSYQGGPGVVARNLLNREFDAAAPNQKWVTDVTEFSVNERKLYLSPVMDLFDRQIISYTIGTSPNLDLTNASLGRALACLNLDEQPLVHSDQGFRTSTVPGALSFRAPARFVNVPQSQLLRQCRDGDFFGHLKEELFNRVRFLSTDALAVALHEYIRWYNNERISTKLEGLSPVQYRAQTLAA